ncbi:hypothetical protein ABPG72_019000 [Tetrahymena utriculariae]
MKNKIIILALFAVFSFQVYCQIQVEALHEFNKWSVKHNKEHNNKSSHTFTLGLNEYVHITSQEFAELILTPSISKSQQQSSKPKFKPQPHPNNSTNTTPCAIKSPTTNSYYPKGVKFLDGSAHDILEGLKSSPVSVLVDVSNWHLYQSGIFNNCYNPVTNHTVLSIGNDENENYIIKNSWGTTWDISGYLILQAGLTCAIDTLPITILV